MPSKVTQRPQGSNEQLLPAFGQLRRLVERLGRAKRAHLPSATVVEISLDLPALQRGLQVGALDPPEIQAVRLGHLVDQRKFDAAPGLPLVDERLSDRQELRSLPWRVVPA